MKSTDSRALADQEEINQEPVFNQENLSVFDRLPIALQRHSLSFLSHLPWDKKDNMIEKQKEKSNFRFGFPSKGSFFFECRASLVASAATKALHNLAHRIKVNETLAFIEKNPNILQTLPFPIEIKDRSGRRIRRSSIIGALAALDEFEVVEVQEGAKPYALIPMVFSLFNGPENHFIKSQLQQQLEEASEYRHKRATEERNVRYLNEIEVLINEVTSCAEISKESDDESFEERLNLGFIQDFIKNAFKPDPQDNGEEGIVWDCWQLHLDYVHLLRAYANNDDVEDKSRPTLGSLWSQKTDVVDTAVYLALLRCSQFCHLEISAAGIHHVASRRRGPVRFDCSEGLPDYLSGIGTTHFFGYNGGKYVAAQDLGGDRLWAVAGAGTPYNIFLEQKYQLYSAYAARATQHEL